jgi:subtilisin family serine protease
MLRRHVADEMILTGTAEAVQRLLNVAKGHGHPLKRRRSLEVAHGNRSLQAGLIQGGATPELVNHLIRILRTEKLKVSVETNCTLGNPFVQELNPWEWEVNPWEWEVNPWEWEVNPSNTPRVIPAGTTAAEGKALFWKQPAFQQVGLVNALGQRIPALQAHQGEGVVVGVFDALPTGPVSEPWLTLHPAAEPIPSPVEASRDLSDHGLMSASLIHAVAPKAQVHLYEVCSKEGYGTMFPLLEALTAFIATNAGKPAVISLSLGSMCAHTSPALRALLQKATDLGMVVVAAAGNRGKAAQKVSTVPQSQLPAGFERVISVAACNLADERATFSQRGDIAAYGGEDLGAPGAGDAEDVIGMGASDPVGKFTGYVAMDGGTSFSTPLVAGAAALVLGDLLQAATALTATTWSEVLAVLKAGARRPDTSAGETLTCTGLGAGILYLPAIWA